jgi:hypothetical protein
MECLHRTKEVSPASEVEYSQSFKADHILLHLSINASTYSVSRPPSQQRLYNATTSYRSFDLSSSHTSLDRSQGQKRSRPISFRNKHTKVKMLEKQQRGEQPEQLSVSD